MTSDQFKRIQTIWVICVDHDYGVWADAGFFVSKAEANSWVFQAHRSSMALHEDLLLASDPDEDLEYSPPSFYAVPLERLYD